MQDVSARNWIAVATRRLLAVGLTLAVLGGAPQSARAQRVSVEVDGKALGKLFERQIGKRWVLLKWGGTARLVLEKPRVSITPLGLYIAGTLKSTTPSFSTAVEVRVRPRVRGARIEVVPASVVVTRPSGVWGAIPRQILTRWLKSSTGASWLAQARLDLKPLVTLLGTTRKPRVRLKLGFGRLTLTMRL